VRELPTPGASAVRTAFSPDGRWLAAVAGGRVHVWDLRSGAEVASGAAGHQGAIAQIVTAPGGLIATAGDDHTVRLWDAATGKEVTRWPPLADLSKSSLRPPAVSSRAYSTPVAMSSPRSPSRPTAAISPPAAGGGPSRGSSRMDESRAQRPTTTPSVMLRRPP